MLPIYLVCHAGARLVETSRAVAQVISHLRPEHHPADLRAVLDDFDGFAAG